MVRCRLRSVRSMRSNGLIPNRLKSYKIAHGGRNGGTPYRRKWVNETGMSFRINKRLRERTQLFDTREVRSPEGYTVGAGQAQNVKVTL